MMILTKRKMKKMRTEMYAVAGTGIVAGVAGLTVATVSLVKENRFEKETNEKIENIEKHVAAVEQHTTKCCKVMIPIQQAMLESGMLKVK